LNSHSGKQKGYGLVAMLACVAAAIAITVVVTLAIERRPPTFSVVGTGVVDTPVSLHREPSDSTPATGDLKAGESVELLQYLPPKTLDSWVLVRPVENKKTYGYAPLRSLDRLETSNADFNVWHATELLTKAEPTDLKERIAAIGKRLETPLPPSPEADQIYRTLATQSVRLANENIGNPDEARALIASAESHLGHLSATEQLSAENEALRSEIQKIQIALGDVEDPAKPVPPPVSTIRTELSRMLKEANTAFSAGRYAKAADLTQQIAAKGKGKREAASIVEQANALHKKAENAQEEFEKVNIQNR
jgi:hypothetical protein